ncbi:hypothetical protein F4805DRAFT_170290 [Annulohypoxylon moriforme]|nr:hypothetical protein F4805DRAFT_170290 [Annulohypoxylon moriforme]
MKAKIYGCAVIISCFATTYLAASVAFSNDVCPSWYFSREIYDYRQDDRLELVATCSTGNTTSNEYVTSRLDISPCFTNHDGALEPAVSGSSDEPGKFVRTCNNCSSSLEGPFGTGKKDWIVILRCSCEKNGIYGLAHVQIGNGVHVNDGVLGCLKYPGAIETYSPSARQMMLPPPGTSISTTTATVNNTVTVTNSFTAISNTTLFSTDTDTAVTTVISSCPSPSQVTVTTTRKGKVHKVTTTATMTETSPVKLLVSIWVTTTVTPKPTIAAELHSTVVAGFTTINK